MVKNTILEKLWLAIDNSTRTLLVSLWMNNWLPMGLSTAFLKSRSRQLSNVTSISPQACLTKKLMDARQQWE